MVMPTPQGYRGEGVFKNFWKLIERWKVTFLVMVPTAATQLMQHRVDADVSTLRYALCGHTRHTLKCSRQHPLYVALTG